MRFTRVVHTTMILLALGPGTMLAQSRFSFTPSFSIYGVYDDNLFFTTTDRTKELYTRYTPTFGFHFGVTRSISLNANYSFDAEVFSEYTELNDLFARQRADVDLTHRLNHRTFWTILVSYTNTNTPRDLYPETGLDFTRQPTEGYVGNLEFDRQIVAGDSLNVSYTFRTINQLEEDRRTQALVFGWRHRFTSRTSSLVRIGPNYGEGMVTAYISASIERRLRRGNMSFAVSRRQNPVPVQTRIIVSSSFFGNISYQLGQPLQLRISPGLSRNSREDIAVNVYRLSLSLVYQFNRWLSIRTSYRGSYQDGLLDFDPDDTPPSARQVYRNEVRLGFTIGYPIYENPFRY